MGELHVKCQAKNRYRSNRFFKTMNFELIIMFLLYHRSVGSNTLADEDVMLVFFTPFYLDCQGFLFKKRKSERVVFAIVVVVLFFCFLTFVVPFSSRCLGQGFLNGASLCCS